jgi:hypothetical protein
LSETSLTLLRKKLSQFLEDRPTADEPLHHQWFDDFGLKDVVIAESTVVGDFSFGCC